jgi:hypothetical protein
LLVKKTAKIGLINPNPERIKISEIVKVLIIKLVSKQKNSLNFFLFMILF